MNQVSYSPIRFSGIEKLYGQNSLEILGQSHVVVVGLGGVGSWSVESIARSGVGKMTLIDGDQICMTNSNRQIHTLKETVGKSKAEILKQRSLMINPEIELETIEEFMRPDNIQGLLGSLKIDVLIDAIDSPRPKAALIDYCLQKSIPIVTCGAAGGKWDPSQIQTDDLGKTKGDALLHRIKKILKKEYGYPPGKYVFNARAVFSPEKIHFFDHDGKIHLGGAGAHRNLDCQTGLGSASFTTGSFGLFAAYEAITLILKEGGLNTDQKL